MKLTGNHVESIKEYESAIKIYEGPLAPSYREISNAHYLISVAYVYNCQEKSPQDQITEKKNALKHVELSRKVNSYFFSLFNFSFYLSFISFPFIT